MRRWLAVRFGHIPNVTIWLTEWEKYVEVADSKKKYYTNKYVSGRQTPFDSIERSAPILLGDKIFFVRVLYSKTKKEIVLDVRQYELEQTELEDTFIPTSNGNILSIEEWESLWKTINKLAKKWKGK